MKRQKETQVLTVSWIGLSSCLERVLALCLWLGTSSDWDVVLESDAAGGCELAGARGQDSTRCECRSRFHGSSKSSEAGERKPTTSHRQRAGLDSFELRGRELPERPNSTSETTRASYDTTDVAGPHPRELAPTCPRYLPRLSPRNLMSTF